MSCTAVQTYYKGDGTQKTFTFNFEYINESDVKVGIYDETTELYVDKAQDDATYGWSFANATTIEFTTAPPADTDAPAGNNIRIYRDTGVDELEATFYPGSSIRAQDLNDNFEQLRMSLEEGQCYFSEGQQSELDNRYWSKIETYTSVDQLAQVVPTDDEVMSALASSDRHDTILSDTTSVPVQPGKLWANTSVNTLNWWDGPNSTWVNSGQAGPKGDKGDKGDPGTPGSGGAEYKGQTDFTAAEPTDPDNGDFYINLITGTGAWNGFIGEEVNEGDRAIYNETAGEWDLISSLATEWRLVGTTLEPVNTAVDTVREENFAVGDAILSSTINATGLTQNRTATLPDKTGTIAFLDDTEASFWNEDTGNNELSPKTDGRNITTTGDVTAGDFIGAKYRSSGDTWTAEIDTTEFISASVAGGVKFRNVPFVKVNNDATITSGGTFRATTNTIPDGTSVNLSDGNNLYYNNTSEIANPTSVEVGQSGLIFFQQAPPSWGTNWNVLGTSYPAYTVAPYYVRTSSQVVVGNPTSWAP